MEDAKVADPEPNLLADTLAEFMTRTYSKCGGVGGGQRGGDRVDPGAGAGEGPAGAGAGLRAEDGAGLRAGAGAGLRAGAGAGLRAGAVAGLRAGTGAGVEVRGGEERALCTCVKEGRGLCTYMTHS